MSIEQFIIRFDFISSIDIEKALDNDIVREIAKYYRKSQPKLTIQDTITNTNITQWIFKSQKNDEVAFTSSHILFKFLNYKNFEHISSTIFKIVETAHDKYELQYRRLGIRYVNKIVKNDTPNENLVSYKSMSYKEDIKSFASETILQKKLGEIEYKVRILFKNIKSEVLPILDLDGFTEDIICEFKDLKDITLGIQKDLSQIYKECVPEGEAKNE